MTEEARPTVDLKFYGAVTLIDWWYDPFADRGYRTVVGQVTILTEADLGFHLRTSGNANYLFQIEGVTGQRVFFPGCKVHSIYSAPKDEFFDRWSRLIGRTDEGRRPDNIYIVP